MITRRSVLLAGGLGLLVADWLGNAQPAPTIRRVGMLLLPSETAYAYLRMAFAQGMHDLGWLEGKNIEYQVAYANADVDRLDAMASALIAQKAEVIVVSSPVVTRAGQRAEDDTDRDGDWIECSGQRVCHKPSQAGGEYHRHHHPKRRGTRQVDWDPA